MAYTGVYVFGDSLVDAGNALKLAQWYGNLTFSDLPEGAPTAQEGYFNGRFSDGYIFADLISNKTIGKVSQPVFPYGFEDPWIGIPIAPWAGDPSGNNLNFAYGGAQVRQGDEVVQDLDSQTDTFRNAVDGDAPPDALYIVTMGGNDVRNLATVTGTAQPPVAGGYAALDKVAQQLIHELGQLINDGAVHFLITGIADVGLIPDYDINNNNLLDSDEQIRSDTATAYSQYLDLLIRTKVVPALEAKGADVTYVSMMDGLTAVLPTLEALHGLAPGTLSSSYEVSPGLLWTGILEHRELVFFDDIHPTAQVHALFGSYAQALLAGTGWIETLPLAAADVDFAVQGAISVSGEVDKMVFALAAGTEYRFDMLGMSTLGVAGSLADPNLRITGNVTASNADDGAGFDAVLIFNPTSSGTYTLELSATGSVTGAYQLQAAVISGAAMTGGQTYTVNSASTIVLEAVGGGGVDTVRASVSYALTPGSEIEILTTTNAKGKGALNLTGNEYDQDIVGNAGANVLDGKGGADIYTGGAGKDVFVLGPAQLASAGNIDRITDYGRDDLVDVTQAISVAAGTNVATGGFVRVTTTGLIQVDANGGGDQWVTLSQINGSGTVSIRYLSGGQLTTVSLSRVAETYALVAAGLAATGVATAPLTSATSGPAEAGAFVAVASSLVDQSDGWHAAGIGHLDATPMAPPRGMELHTTAGDSGPMRSAEGFSIQAASASLDSPITALLEATALAAPALPELGGAFAVAPDLAGPSGGGVARIIADALGSRADGLDLAVLLDALPHALPSLANGAELAAPLADLAIVSPMPLMGLEAVAMHADALATV